MLGSIEMILIDNAKSYRTSPLEGTDLVPIQDLSESIENNIVSNRIEKPDIAFIESTTRVALKEQSSVDLIEVNKMNGEISIIDSPENKRLTDDEKAKIKEETSWSDEIIDNIQNIKQYENLKSAGLVEAEINGRKCLIKENIDLDYTDDDGISNRDRITRGLAPLDNKTGKPLELHHLGQKADSPLIELTVEEHRTGEYEDGKKNQSLWHDNTLETEVHGEGNSWTQERKEHWKARSEQNLKGNE
ncbi:endonuclease VII [Photobacterium carnosum]|uniref:HNH/ENDO VII family nuclease n=1 Tax=Photobacterium carnosum TaxID=2023717 RepID=UPI001C8FFC96|nr:HNH/ENDO VII family nuclease [Photobacterium carnosum]MBY3787651.1 endonuclease VII [Photobacterium carnosum]MCD9532281.1 endonuclease VII [Photobacterium carnosum]